MLTANLHRDDTASKLEPLGADQDSTDGLNPNLVIIDELHAHEGPRPDRRHGDGDRRAPQPINFQITTAGDDPLSPCGDQHDYACKILERVFADETFFAFIAHADLERRLDGRADLAEGESELRRVGASRTTCGRWRARRSTCPPAAAAFKQKRLNLWVNADRAVAVARRLAARADALDRRRAARRALLDRHRPVVEDRPDGRRLPVPADGDAPRLAGRSARCLTPDDTLDERAHRDRAPYRVWVEQGCLRTNPGNRIDQDVVRDLVLEAAAPATTSKASASIRGTRATS